MPAPAFLVVGEAGEYDDYCDWVVAVSLDRSDAEKLCRKLNEIVASFSFMKFNRGSNRYFEAWKAEVGECERKLRAAGDPEASVSYSGITYEVQETRLLGVAQ